MDKNKENTKKLIKKIKFSIFAKIILLEIVVLCIMRFFVPVLLNYPPMSEEIAFQSQIEPISHTQQYILLGAIGILAYILCLTAFCSRIFKYLNLLVTNKSKINFDLIKRVRKDCFAIPKKLIIVQVILIIIVLFMLFAMMNANIQICFKFLLIYFSFFTVIAILASSLIKKELDTIIKSTYDMNSNYSDFKKTGKFSMNLMFNLLPFFLVIIITISLLGYAKVTSAIGEGNYNYYKLYFSSIDFENISSSELPNLLSTIRLKDENDYLFVVFDENTYYTSQENKELSDFFIKYLYTYYDQTSGRVYEYYGVEEEGYALRINVEDMDKPIYVGCKYSTTNEASSIFFIYISIASIFIYIVILLIWSKSISKSLVDITNNLVQISNGKNALTNKILPVTSKDELGELTVAFNQIQKMTSDYLQQIQNNQNLLMERERLASLGQLIGGIAHNLKTPIMSISGATEGLNDLINEYDESIGDPDVTQEDHHAIAKDMTEWVSKIKSYSSYMSDVITAVKGQAVSLSENESIHFDVDELIKRINILMKHELKHSLTNLNIKINIDSSTNLHGDITSLVQVINNMISNSIQAYDGEPNKDIDLTVDKKDNNIIISVRDYGSGLPKKVQDKLFKEMITTKGKNGTGLGLFMSYSTIRAHFNGDITFDTSSKGTTFYITIPMN